MRYRADIDGLRAVAHQVGAGQEKQPRIPGARGPVPGVERARVPQLRGQARVVEGEERAVVHQHVGAPRTVLELLDLVEGPESR